MENNGTYNKLVKLYSILTDGKGVMREISTSNQEQIASTEEIVSIANTLDDLSLALNELINYFDIEK